MMELWPDRLARTRGSLQGKQEEKAEGRRQKAAKARPCAAQDCRWRAAYCLLPSAFCFLPSLIPLLRLSSCARIRGQVHAADHGRVAGLGWARGQILLQEALHRVLD